jgi:MFS transporter, DHA2 family, multidrug resistance protein
MPDEKRTAIAGMINFARNIGSSVGTSFVTTMLARRAQFHQNVLASVVTVDNVNLGPAVNELATRLGLGGLDCVGARGQAYVRLYAEMLRQAGAMSFVDAYWLLGLGSGTMLFTAFFLKRNDPHHGGPVAGH